MLEEPIVRVEYAAAKREGRQPRCPYCGALLSVRQKQRETIYWRWDGKQFKKYSDTDAEPPYCMNCNAEDWNFIDNDLVGF